MREIGAVQARDKFSQLLDWVERAEQLKLGPFDWSEWKAFRDEGRS
jgi:hypothetical protein